MSTIQSDQIPINGAHHVFNTIRSNAYQSAHYEHNSILDSKQPKATQSDSKQLKATHSDSKQLKTTQSDS